MSTSRPLGIAVAPHDDGPEDVTSVIIPPGTPLPASLTQTYYTSVHGQKEVKVEVLSGWMELAKENQTLGVFSIQVPPKPRREVSVDVTFGKWSTLLFSSIDFG